ncbi:MAG: lmo0937 family membrane protein [Chitinophagaceae bacterium]
MFDIKFFNHLNFLQMGNLLYVIAVILVIIWIFGAFVSPFGGNLIHILLVIAIIAILLKVINRAA